MPSYAPHTSAANFQTVLHSFGQVAGLPFPQVLTAEHIERVAAEEGVAFGAAPGNIYTGPGRIGDIVNIYAIFTMSAMFFPPMFFRRSSS